MYINENTVLKNMKSLTWQPWRNSLHARFIKKNYLGKGAFFQHHPVTYFATLIIVSLACVAGAGNKWAQERKGAHEGDTSPWVRPFFLAPIFFLAPAMQAIVSFAAFLSLHGALRDKTKRAAIRGYLDEMKLDSIVVFQEQL